MDLGSTVAPSSCTGEHESGAGEAAERAAMGSEPPFIEAGERGKMLPRHEVERRRLRLTKCGGCGRWGKALTGGAGSSAAERERRCSGSG